MEVETLEGTVDARNTGEVAAEVRDPSTMTDEELNARLYPKEEKRETENEVKQEPLPAKTEVVSEEAKPVDEKKDAEAKPVADTFNVKEEIQKLQRRIEEKENMIQRQALELGELRKVTSAPKDDVDDAIEDNESTLISLLDKPKEFKKEIANIAMKVVEAREKQQKELEAKDREVVKGIREIVSKTIPDFQELIPHIADICVESGDNPETIEAFKTNPYRPMAGNPQLFNSLIIAARERKRARDLEASLTKNVVKKAAHTPSNGGIVNGKGGSSVNREYIPDNISEIPNDILRERLSRFYTKVD